MSFAPAALGLSHVGAAVTCTSSVLLVDAHPDDHLLFQSPDLLHDIQGGGCVRTVLATSGDAGADPSYWQSRELGAKAAAANMAGVANAWIDSDMGIPGHPMKLSSLRDRPGISIVYMRLPDGNLDGSGFPAYGSVSMQKLWAGSISSIGTEDNSSSYTRQSLIGTLSTIIALSRPVGLRVQDYVGQFGDNDHSDHHAVAYFTEAAARQVSGTYNFTGYQDYGTATRLANVIGTDLTNKQNAFFAYAKYDSGVCGSVNRCKNTDYAKWLQRQYTVGQEVNSGTFPTLPVANAGQGGTVPSGSLVQLDGGASYSPTASGLRYAWTEQSGPPITLSDATSPTPTFTAPSGDSTVVLSLIVSDSSGSSPAATVTVVVAATGVNVARTATPQASSQNSADGQTASSAIDGCIDGWPGNYGCEWATNGEKAGAWLTLSWAQPVTIDHVTLWDRPNADDQVLQGSLTFSDGGTNVAVGTLPNDASSGLVVSFAARTVTWIKLTITTVSAATQNIGLAEMQVFTPTQQSAAAAAATKRTPPIIRPAPMVPAGPYAPKYEPVPANQRYP